MKRPMILLCVPAIVLMAAQSSLARIIPPDDLLGVYRVDGFGAIGQPVLVISFDGVAFDITGIQGDFSFASVDGLFILSTTRLLLSGQNRIDGFILIKGSAPTWYQPAFAILLEGATPSFQILGTNGAYRFDGLGPGLKTLIIIGLAF